MLDDIHLRRSRTDVKHHDRLHRFFNHRADGAENLYLIETCGEFGAGNDLLEERQFVIMNGDEKHFNGTVRRGLSSDGLQWTRFRHDEPIELYLSNGHGDIFARFQLYDCFLLFRVGAIGQGN